MRNVILAIVILAILGGIGFYFFFPVCEVNSVLCNEYVIEMPYRRVIGILARKNVLEDIVATNEGKVVERSWHNFTLNIDRIVRPEWRVSAEGNFVVVTDDPHAGPLRLEFIETVQGSEKELRINTNLVRPHKGIRIHQTLLVIEPLANDQTAIWTCNQLAVGYRAPIGWHEKIRWQVINANQAALANSEKCIRNALKNGKLITIPLKWLNEDSKYPKQIK